MDGSVTHWIGELKQGQEGAVQEQLFNRYLGRLQALARHKLGSLPRRGADEEDVVQSALESFFVRVKQGQFPQLKDRDNLWPLLVKITARKAIDLRQRELAQKRGGGKVRGESVFGRPDGGGHGIEQIVGQEPTPQFADDVVQQYHELLTQLGDETLQLVACRKLEGFTNAEIAAELGRVEKTVERKLERIRAIWSEQMGE